jgi:hypothetical protein
MKHLLRSMAVAALFVLCAGSGLEKSAAKGIVDGEGNVVTGGGGGRWYSMGSVTEVRYCQSWEQTIVFWPPPPHYEVRVTTVAKEVYYLLEACYMDNAARECTPGTQRKTYQGGGC